jgi:hypothetical protein
MNTLFLVMLAMLISPAQAVQVEAVFKCVIDNKTVYQAEPCPSTAVKKVEIDIEKPDPAKTAEAQERLKAWEADFATREAAEQKARQQQENARLKQAEIDALNRNARAQAEMAEAAKRRFIINRPVLVNPYYGFPLYPPHRRFQNRHDDDDGYRRTPPQQHQRVSPR